MKNILIKSKILLPKAEIDKSKWATIANDSEPVRADVLKKVENAIGDAPSTIRLTLPASDTPDSRQRIAKIHDSMYRCINENVLATSVDGFVLVERATSVGLRPSIVAALDLEQYDPAGGSLYPVRPAENANCGRAAAFMHIRTDAPLEMSNATVLIDDPGQTVIESLYARRRALRPLYDFDLMQDCGHIRGWAIEDANAESLLRAFNALSALSGNPAFLTVDGYSTLCAAKQCWENVRATLPPRAREGHPMRYTLVEVINACNQAVEFEPIHRIVYGANPLKLATEFNAYLKKQGIPDVAGNDLTMVTRFARMSYGFEKHPLPTLEAFLKEYASTHPEIRVEAVRDSDTLSKRLADAPEAIGFLFRAFKRNELFPTVRKFGTLPEKSFRMGEPTDRRFLMEVRTLE